MELSVGEESEHMEVNDNELLQLNYTTTHVESIRCYLTL